VNAFYGRLNGDGYPRRPQPEAGRRRASYKSRAPSGRASAASGCGRTGITCLRQLRCGVAATCSTAPVEAIETPVRASCRALREKRQMCSLRRGCNVILPGQYADGETGLNYNYFRDYDPGVGRYVESDPIGLSGGSYSTYAHSHLNPLSYSDPTGLVANPAELTCADPLQPVCWLAVIADIASDYGLFVASAGAGAVALATPGDSWRLQSSADSERWQGYYASSVY
jgi:RHS repeat-associated protein